MFTYMVISIRTCIDIHTETSHMGLHTQVLNGRVYICGCSDFGFQDGSDVASFPACLLDNLYLLRCGTPFAFLPTTLPSSSFSSLVYTPDLIVSPEGYSNSSSLYEASPSSQGHFHIPSPKKPHGSTKSPSSSAPDVSRSGEGKRRRKMKASSAASSSSESMITAPRKSKPPRSSSQPASKGGKDMTTTAVGAEERGEEEICSKGRKGTEDVKGVRNDRASHMREEDLVDIPPRSGFSSSTIDRQHTSGRGRGEGERGGEIRRDHAESGQHHRHHHHPHQSTRGEEDEEGEDDVDEDEEFLLQQRLEQLAAIPPFLRFKAVLERLLKIDDIFFQYVVRRI